jgi:hypothetical protein
MRVAHSRTPALSTSATSPEPLDDAIAPVPALRAHDLTDEIGQIDWNAEWHLLLDVSPLIASFADERSAEPHATRHHARGQGPYLPTSAVTSLNDDGDWDGGWQPAPADAPREEPGAAPSAAGGKGTGGSGGGGGKGKSGGSHSGTTPDSGSGTPTEVKLVWPALDPQQGDATLPTDTYFAQQWALTGQYGGINVAGVWKNYTGQGIKIGIVDDGIDFNHPDLDDHYLSTLDYDAVTGGTSALGVGTEGHGTTVAGVVAAARDGTGIVGVAYDAGFAGFRISYSTGGPAELADALNHLVTSGMHIGNASWGYATISRAGPRRDRPFSTTSQTAAAASASTWSLPPATTAQVATT